MNETTGSPFFVALLFILRCLVPLAILFGVSYLLRRLGLVNIENSEPSEDPRDKEPSSPVKSKES